MSDKKDAKKSKKNWTKILDTLASPVTIGLLITAGFIYFSANFYEHKNDNSEEKKGLAYQIFEWIDQKTMDSRFLTRGPKKSTNKIAVLAIDDKSIEEIGRWPWSREKVSHMVEELMKYGAKTIGFDIVFAEPQVDNSLKTLNLIETKMTNLSPDLKEFVIQQKEAAQPDKVLAETIKKNGQKMVMGAFADEVNTRSSRFYDYCFDEAFKLTDDHLISEVQEKNPIVLENLDPGEARYYNLPFGEVLKASLADIAAKATKSVVEKFGKQNIDELTPQEQYRVKEQIKMSYFEYCNNWLSKDSDPYYANYEKESKKIFAEIPELAGYPFEDALNIVRYSMMNIPFPLKRNWTGNTPELQKNAPNTALFNALVDNDGTIRTAGLIYRAGSQPETYIHSLALGTFLVANNMVAQFTLSKDIKHPDQLVTSELKIFDPESEDPSRSFTVPVDAQGRLLINYAGKQKMFPYLRASELFHDRPTAIVTEKVWNDRTQEYEEIEHEVNKAEFIKDRIFIAGATAVGIYDLRTTPFENNYPGVETHINVIDNLTSRDFLRTHPAEKLYMLATVVVLGCLLSVLLTYSGALVGLLITLFTSVTIYFVDKVVLFKHGWVASTAIPMSLVVFLYVLMTFYKYLTEERKKKHLRSTFSKYVSPAIVDEILKDPENIELGGRKQRMTVFFSDVRGFTTISEKLDPQVLSKVLNDYLTPMTQIVFSNKGTLDKYMGDAVMAFFGAPIFFDDHAKYACRCALQSIEKLKLLQKEFKEKGLPEIDIGIGLNTAEMSVGNMGSDIVRNYTVMGDAVNLGSRLEGINKEYGTRIIISEFTHADVKEAFTAREVDWVRVKGKNQPIRIYELICEGQPPSPHAEMIKHFNEGFGLYHAKDFGKAKDLFKKAMEIMPQDPVSELYIERCEDYLKEAPPENWDGVYVMKTK